MVYVALKKEDGTQYAKEKKVMTPNTYAQPPLPQPPPYIANNLGYLSPLKYQLKLEKKPYVFTDIKVSSSTSLILYMTTYRLYAYM